MTVEAFYRRKRVLVTGLTGFKGVWLGSWLRRLGAQVSGLALPPDPAMTQGWPQFDERFKNHAVDVRDAAAVSRVFEVEQPEVVFHLAAQPLVRRSYREPVETFATNVLGTVHVLDAARNTPSVSNVVVVTSDKCYENREWSWGYRENEAMGGHDPYSASKGCAELVTASYRRSFAGDGRLQIASVRAGNVIGGGDWSEDRLVPDLIKAIFANQPLNLRNPHAVRPWQHVLEPLSGYLMLGARLGESACFAHGWNFGPAESRPWTVRDVARKLVELHGAGKVVENGDVGAPHEANLLRLDSTKAEIELGWSPLLSIEDRLRWTLDWYVASRRDANSVWKVTDEQIREYEQRIAQCDQFKEQWCPGSAASSAPRSHAA